MAAGEYVSVKSQDDTEASDLKMESEALENALDGGFASGNSGHGTHSSCRKTIWRFRVISTTSAAAFNTVKPYAGSGFESLCWETPAITASNLGADHEFAVVESPTAASATRRSQSLRGTLCVLKLKPECCQLLQSRTHWHLDRTSATM